MCVSVTFAGDSQLRARCACSRIFPVWKKAQPYISQSHRHMFSKFTRCTVVAILRRQNKMISRTKTTVQIYILQHHGISSGNAACDWLAAGDVWMKQSSWNAWTAITWIWYLLFLSHLVSPNVWLEALRWSVEWEKGRNSTLSIWPLGVTLIKPNNQTAPSSHV